MRKNSCYWMLRKRVPGAWKEGTSAMEQQLSLIFLQLTDKWSEAIRRVGMARLYLSARECSGGKFCHGATCRGVKRTNILCHQITLQWWLTWGPGQMQITFVPAGPLSRIWSCWLTLWAVCSQRGDLVQWAVL